LRIQSLHIENLRVISRASFKTDASLIAIVGPNASGKTSVLEAISSLFYGSSFRTRRNQQLIRFEEGGYLVRAGVKNESAVTRLATERRLGEDARFKMDGEDVRPTAIIRKYPSLVIDAGIFGLIEGSPSERRRFVDWGMFHVKHNFYDLWRDHRNVLSQWNALLRARAKPSEFAYWQNSLVKLTEQLTDLRQEYIKELSLVLKESDQSVFGGLSGVELGYQRGWPKDLDFTDYLERELVASLSSGGGRDSRLKGGVQLFDMVIRHEGRLVKDTFSRGQKKLLGLQLKVAQIKLYNKQLSSCSTCTVLVDDIAAEVDEDNQTIAIRELLGTGAQVFVTAIDVGQIQKVIKDVGVTDNKMFHVKHGEFIELHS